MTELPHTALDPFTLQVVRDNLASLADEMALSVLRTAHSEVVRDTMDFSTAIFDAQGQVVAQGLTLPLHLGAMPDALNWVLEEFGDDLAAGDVYCLNDPAQGGMHLPDLFIFGPVFYSGSLIGFAGCVAHHIDVGGKSPGSNAVDSTEIFQEGLQIPVLRLYEQGQPNATLMKIIDRNVRLPAVLMGDIRAQLGACHVGEQGLISLAKSYGSATLAACMESLLDYSEELFRAELSRIPDGEYAFTDYLDDDGMGSGNVPISVRLDVSGDSLTADFSGSAPEVRSALNATLSFTKAAVYAGLMCAVDSDQLISNAGLYRAVTVSAPAASVVNGSRVAPKAARGVTGFRAIDAVLGALHLALPERILAAGEGGGTMIAFGGKDTEGESLLFVEFVAGSWGARPRVDGIDGISPLGANLSNVPVEVIEARHAVRVESYGFVPDTGGAGKYRGGLSVSRELRFLGSEGEVQIRSDRREVRPYGLAGGSSGAPSITTLRTHDGEELLLPTKVTRSIGHGDVLRHVTAGGGGYGSPREREYQSLLADVISGKISVSHTAEAYGISIPISDIERLPQASPPRKGKVAE